MGLWHSVVWKEQQQVTWRVCVSDQQPTGSEGSLGGDSEQRGCLVCTQEGDAWDPLMDALASSPAHKRLSSRWW